MLELSFEIEGDKLLLRHLEGVSEKLADWRSTFKETGGYLMKTFKNNFSVSGSLLEKPWVPLSPKTVANKQRLGMPFPSMPLIGRGQMMEAFASDPQRMSVRVYNPVEYFKYHQSNKPRRIIPRRVMISLTEKMREMIVKMFQGRIEEALKFR